MALGLAEGYRLIQAAPTVEDYLELRRRSGLTPRTREQAVAALPGSWFACHIVHEATGHSVAMGRVLGDGGWYFHVVDMAVLPEHQRRGLGDAVLTALLLHVRANAPAGAKYRLLRYERCLRCQRALNVDVVVEPVAHHYQIQRGTCRRCSRTR